MLFWGWWVLVEGPNYFWHGLLCGTPNHPLLVHAEIILNTGKMSDPLAGANRQKLPCGIVELNSDAWGTRIPIQKEGNPQKKIRDWIRKNMEHDIPEWAIGSPQRMEDRKVSKRVCSGICK